MLIILYTMVFILSMFLSNDIARIYNMCFVYNLRVINSQKTLDKSMLLCYNVNSDVDEEMERIEAEQAEAMEAAAKAAQAAAQTATEQTEGEQTGADKATQEEGANAKNVKSDKTFSESN